MNPPPTKIFIVTPCFNGMPWLPGCVASVRNQVSDSVRCYDLSVKQDLVSQNIKPNNLKLNTENLKHRLNEPIHVHHHVQDGGSTDGTVDWLRQYDGEVRGQRSEVSHLKTEHIKPNTAISGYTFSYASEPDNGMYDAINKGWDRADKSVDWLGHLNSDEQYQPGVLERIALAGGQHPRWGTITGNCIWVDREGNYLCSRKPTIGWPWVGRVWIPAATCALFVRRRYYGGNAVRFDTSWKSFGDKVFCRDLLNAGCKFGYLDEYMAVFVHRGTENLGFQPITEIERLRYWNESLSALERRVAPVSVFAAKASRTLRNQFGRRCRAYRWIDKSGLTLYRDVDSHRWSI